MKKMESDLKSLVSSGLLGAGIFSVLSKNKQEGVLLGALLGVVFEATRQANVKAREMKFPLLQAEGGALYRIHQDGTKEYIKDLPKAKKHWDLEFELQ